MFTLFYMCAEGVSALISMSALSFCWACTVLKGSPGRCSDYVGLFSVITMSLSNIAHLLAIVISPILLYKGEDIPIIFDVFITYQFAFALYALSRFFKISHEEKHFMNPVISENIRKAETEIKEARSRSSSLQSEFSVYMAEVGGRATRSTSNYVGRKEIEPELKRERSVSTGTSNIVLKIPTKAVEGSPSKLTLAR
mmetsp:Transcript_12545/g.12616  ORF Transcript_12545/g.12616 Transcript_12545/m.12616 type:complete len:197 (+) Transcript_12545:104-694(+)